ncbi:hypothetical protein AAMO2058_000456200 [Amorphochlora amoebiformis]
MATQAACLLSLIWLVKGVEIGLLSRRNITMYHVNPANYSGLANKNTADAAGDATFDIYGLAAPSICHNGSSKPFPGLCDNPEQAAPDLVTTKVLVEVYSNFSEYGRCNICRDIPAFKEFNCTVGEYICTCGDFTNPYVCNSTEVGFEDIRKVFGSSESAKPKPGDDVWKFWLYNLINRTGGYWYSMPSKGENRTWRQLSVIKRINTTCQHERLEKLIVQKGDKSCFQNCPNPSNHTTDCYINCLFQALLGKDGGYVLDPADGLSGMYIHSIVCFHMYKYSIE